jgi:3-oxoacyl-[acyl-carrier-protein] synthase II
VAAGRSIEPCLAAADGDALDWGAFGRTAFARTEPERLWQVASHSTTAWVSRLCRARGDGVTIMTACTAGAQALGAAMHALRRGDVDVAIAGGASAMIDPVSVIGFSRLQALSTRNDAPTAASRPFERNRDGFVLGEGAGVLVLERPEQAHARGAGVVALLAGYAATADAYRVTDSEPTGRAACRAMRGSLADAGFPPDAVDYVNAHGTSTAVNDRVETLAIRALLGERARAVPVSSNKSMIGHLIAAAGAVEAIATVLTVTHGSVPPTINYADPDPECDLDYVPNQARPADVRTALSNSFGFGGQNACLVIRRPHDA